MKKERYCIFAAIKMALCGILLFIPSHAALAWQQESYDSVTGIYTYQHIQNNDTIIQYDMAGGSNANYLQNGFTFKSSSVPYPGDYLIKTIKLPICNNGGSGIYKVLLVNIPNGGFTDSSYYPADNTIVAATFTQKKAPIECSSGNGQGENMAVFTLENGITLNNSGKYIFVLLEDTVNFSTITNPQYRTPVKWVASEGLYLNTYQNYSNYNLPIWFWTSYYNTQLYTTSDPCIPSSGLTGRANNDINYNCSDPAPAYLPDFIITGEAYVTLPVGQCGNTPFSCIVGTSTNNYIASSTYQWNCNAEGGIASCSSPYTPEPTNGQCSSSPFVCLTGYSVNNVTATTSYEWNCNGINGGDNAQCTLPLSASSTVSIPYPVITYEECGVTNITGCIKNAFLWATVPPQDAFQPYYDLMDKMKRKFPIGYLTAYAELFTFDPNSTSTEVLILVQQGTPLMQYIFTPLRNVLEIIIYLFAAVWFFKRVKDVNL